MAKDFDKAREEINRIDKEMAKLFTRRMRAVEHIAKHKKENRLPIFDGDREREIIDRAKLLVDEDLCEYYVDFIKSVMSVSKSYQRRLVEDKDERVINVSLGDRSYNIHVGRGLSDRAGEILNLQRRVFIVTDSGVPKEYANKIKNMCESAEIVALDAGEASKNYENYIYLCRKMSELGITRGDCVVAVGGGMVGDIAGFAAATYMRGIDFYNIPTTLLSQIDSSIGGKTAINLDGAKNTVGAFYQPKGVIVDPDLLKTLSARHLRAGLVEAIKMALTSDEELFRIIEGENIDDKLEEIILRSIKIKRSVVEADEREGGLRKILNFGHTLGHAIEAAESGRLYHGECVAIGMIPVCSSEVRERLVPLLEAIGLSTSYDGNMGDAISFIAMDKKRDGDTISVIFVDDIGSYRIEKMDVNAFCNLVREEK